MKYIIPRNPIDPLDAFRDDCMADLSDMYDYIQTGILTAVIRASHAFMFTLGSNTFIVSPGTDIAPYRITCFDSIGPVYHENYYSINDLIKNGLHSRVWKGKEIITC